MAPGCATHDIVYSTWNGWIMSIIIIKYYTVHEMERNCNTIKSLIVTVEDDAFLKKKVEPEVFQSKFFIANLIY